MAERPQSPPEQPLPEEFAPTGPMLSRFPIRPPPSIRLRLFADEARFARRLALLAGGTELAAWAWIARLAVQAGSARGASVAAALVVGTLRVARPLWALAGTKAPRALLAFSALFVALALNGLALFSPVALPGSEAVALLAALSAGGAALGDLCASCIADSVTVERRTAAFSFLEIGQGLGCALGLGFGAAFPWLVPLASASALLVGGLFVPELRDRGTPRSTWPLALYRVVLATPLVRQLSLLAGATGALSCWVLASRAPSGPAFGLLPLAGMALVARLEPSARNAAIVPRAVALLAGAAFAAIWVAPAAAAPAALLALGGASSALPAAVARGAYELERPVASSLVWAALALGAGAGCALAARSW